MKEQSLERKRCSRKLRILIFSLIMLLAFIQVNFAQTIMVRGTVTDVAGKPLPGVNVTVKGTTIGTATTVDGKYLINSPSSGVLVFTFIGMTSKEVEVNNRREIDIILEEDIAGLDEVVVVGYGTQKKIHLTGSVVAVTDTEIRKTTASNISQTLVGKLPGIVSQQATGGPGSDGVTMLVRGYSSYNGSSPLVLVDGVERSMARIDPNDVESVTVLKDAASSAVYGMKAANGVILITTKKGSEGDARVTYRGSVTGSHLTTMPKFMNGTQYMQYYNMALEMDGESPFFTAEEIAATYNGDTSDGYENTNWMSAMDKTTVMHQHNLSVSGDTQKSKYFISGGFLEQNGIIKDHKNQRGNFRSNIEINAKENLKVSLNLAGNVQDYYQPGWYPYGNQESYNIFHLMMYSLPFVPKEYQGMPTSGYRSASNAANPYYGSQNSGFHKNRNLNLETSANIEYTFPFLKGLKAGMAASWDWAYADGKTFGYAYYVMAYTFSRTSTDRGYTYAKGQPLLENGNLESSKSESQKVVLRPYVSYTQKFGKHNVGGLFFYEQTTNKSSQLSGSRTEFELLDLAELNLGSSATAKNSGSSGKSAFAGFVGRVNYAYDDKYLAEISSRYDGSYLFAKGHRWGFFPSASVGWVASHEEFFNELFPKIDLFKLRASVGLLGSANINPFLYRKSFSKSANSVAFGYPATSEGTLYNTVSYPNENLTWEKCRSMNIGFDLSMWNGLFGMEFDYFYKYTYDILQTVSSVYPPSLGGHYPSTENSGTFDNRGFELVLKHSNYQNKVMYNLTGNLTYAHNRILKRTQSDNIPPWQNVLGTSVGSYWGLKSDGLYQTEEELLNAPKPIGASPRLGDIKYVDINGDGKITSDDFVKIAKSRMPEMMFSFTADASYMGFDASVMLQGAALTDKMLQGYWNSGAADANPLTIPWYGNYDNAPLYLVERSWRPDNTDAEYPRLSVTKPSFTNNAQVSDFWKRNGAYLRLKNVTVGYTIPQRVVSKLKIDNIRLYVSGHNLLTFTQFKYIDPESANVITGYYPQQRTYSFGVDITF